MDTAIRRHPTKDNAASAVIGHEGATTMIAAKRLARIAGVLYLLVAIFGVFAVAIACAMVFNGRMVMHYGMRNLSKWAVRGCIAFSFIFLVVALMASGHPPLWTLGLFLFATFFCCGDECAVITDEGVVEIDPDAHG